MNSQIARRRARFCFCLGAVAGVLGLFHIQAPADETWTYAVQISAAVQQSPASVTLSWAGDRFGVDSWTIYRKDPGSTAWSFLQSLDGGILTFTDNSIAAGRNYEYQVVKKGTAGYMGYGYICAGINSPAIEDRGKIVLIVSADVPALSSELNRLSQDLTGDGWMVLRHDIDPTMTPVQLKAVITSDYYSDPARVKAVFLLGSVPVFMSGNIEYDSHGQRPMPADAFYGDMDGNWHPDWAPIDRPGYLPSDVELMVGRVDFSNLPSIGNETELLRRYLNKDHAWRQKDFTVPARALIANRVGDAGGMAYAASAYRNFQPLVGPGNIVEAAVSDTAADSERWISVVSREPWLWSYACGGGQMYSISHMGTHGDYKEAWSTDLVSYDAKAVFSMLFGSHFGEWNGTDNLIRSMLAANSVSLTTCLVGLPHYYFHFMGKGEPIGQSIRLTMNNSGLYTNMINEHARSVLVNLHGDPTLRMEMVAPPRNLSGTSGTATPALQWTQAAEPVLGYNIYRATSPTGLFSRVNNALVTATSFTDTTPSSTSNRTYLVRSVALTTNPSGTYYNLSQAAFVTVNAGPSDPPPPPPPPPPTTNTVFVPSTIRLTSSGPEIQWDAQSGQSFHVEGMVLIYNNDWVDLSGKLTAQGTRLSFVDTDWIWYATRFYRVKME